MNIRKLKEVAGLNKGVMARAGSTVLTTMGSNAGAIERLESDRALSRNELEIRAKRNISNEDLYEQIENYDFEALVKGVAIDMISTKSVAEIEVSI